MPSNLNSTGVSLSFATSCIFALMALAESIAALLADHWFDYANLSANSLDLWYSCSGSNCSAISYTDVNIGICTLSGKEIQGRFFALRGLLIAGAVFCLFYTLFILVGRLCDSVTTQTIGVICSFLGLFCFVSTIGLFYDTIDNFMFCGLTPCEYFKQINPTSSSQCYYMYGGAYGLVWTAAAASLLSAIIGITALIKMRSPERLEKIHGLVPPSSRPTSDAGALLSSSTIIVAAAAATSPREINNSSSNNNNNSFQIQENLSQNRKSHRDQTASIATQLQRQMPRGLEDWRMDAQDFELDQSSGLYYSDEAQIYWDKSSNQFFDPSRKLWWDPVEGLWKNDA